MLWLTALGLMLASLGVFAITSGRWRRPAQAQLGWMSEQWLEEHRAGSR